MKKGNKVNGSPISQNGRFVNPFSEKSFEAVIAQNLSDVKSFLKYFSESPLSQTEENVKSFFKIFVADEIIICKSASVRIFGLCDFGIIEYHMGTSRSKFLI